MNKGISNLSITQKICLTGLMIALTTILQKVLAINYLAALPFFRLSFGAPALIVFSSIFLGPFWGGIVGLFSDLLGYFAFDASGYAYKPQIGLIYLALGVGSFFIFKLISKIKKEKLAVVQGVVLGAFFVFFTVYLEFFFECSIYTRILIPLGLLCLIIGIFLFQKFYKNKEAIYSTTQISFSYLLCDIIFLLFFGSLMKAWAFTIYFDDFLNLFILVFATQSLVMIFNVFLNTILLSTFFRLTKKYVREQHDRE